MSGFFDTSEAPSKTWDIVNDHLVVDVFRGEDQVGTCSVLMPKNITEEDLKERIDYLAAALLAEVDPSMGLTGRLLICVGALFVTACVVTVAAAFVSSLNLGV